MRASPLTDFRYKADTVVLSRSAARSSNILDVVMTDDDNTTHDVRGNLRAEKPKTNSGIFWVSDDVTKYLEENMQNAKR